MPEYAKRNANGTYTYLGQVYKRNWLGNWDDSEGRTFNKYATLGDWQAIANALDAAHAFYTKSKGSNYLLGEDGLYTRYGSQDKYGILKHKNGKSYYVSNLGATDATWNKEKGIWEREGFTYTPTQTADGKLAFAWKANESAQPELPGNTTTTNTTTTTTTQTPGNTNIPYNTFLQHNLATKAARRNWVNEHKDYLKAKRADIDWDNYAFTGNLNIALANLLGGVNDWYAQQAEAGRRMNEGLTKLEAPIITPVPVKANDVPIKIAGPAVKRVGGKVIKDENPAGGIKKIGDTTYEQKNDSTFVWDGPNNSKGKVQFYPVSLKEPEVTYRQYDRNSGESLLVPITDPAVRQQHIENTQSGGFKKPNVIQRLYRKYRGYGEFKKGGSINYQKIFR